MTSTNSDPLEKAAQYSRDVLTGKIKTGRLTQLAVERHDQDLKEGSHRGLFFCEESARRALTLFGFLNHSKGINRTVSLMPREIREKNNMALHEVDFRVLSPSEALEKIAIEFVSTLPLTIRSLLFTLGALKKSGSNLVSYLLFEREFCRALIKLGYQDTMLRRDELMRFLGYEACWL